VEIAVSDEKKKSDAAIFLCAESLETFYENIIDKAIQWWYL
jgi:hypothetical protein